MFRSMHPTDEPGLKDLPHMLNEIVWAGTFLGKFEDRGEATRVFRRHIEEVKNDVPADRLLVYEVKEGWEALCSFLGVPIPEGVPFPHLNDRAAFAERAIRWRRGE